MKSYGQFCPVAKAAELFCERWTALILRELATGSTRYSQIARGVPLMSPTLLSRRLRQLEAEGVVERRRAEEGKGHSYHLTQAGCEFWPIINGLANWGQRWSRRELAENEIDLGLLLWSVEKCARADAFGGERSVLRFEFTDQPAQKRLWWFVNEGGSCEMCAHDPGFPVDLFVASALADLIYVVRGDLKLERAIASDRLEVIGPAPMRRRLATWLNLSPWAAIAPARERLDAEE